MNTIELVGLGVFVVSALVFFNSVMELRRMRDAGGANTQRRRRKSVVSFLRHLPRALHSR
jgi:hypothetical protein